jgi:hypothetical protein
LQAVCTVQALYVIRSAGYGLGGKTLRKETIKMDIKEI